MECWSNCTNSFAVAVVVVVAQLAVPPVPVTSLTPLNKRDRHTINKWIMQHGRGFKTVDLWLAPTTFRNINWSRAACLPRPKLTWTEVHCKPPNPNPNYNPNHHPYPLFTNHRTICIHWLDSQSIQSIIYPSI